MTIVFCASSDGSRSSVQADATPSSVQADATPRRLGDEV